MFNRLFPCAVTLAAVLTANPGLTDDLPGERVVVNYAYAIDGSDPVGDQIFCEIEKSCEIGSRSDPVELTLLLTKSVGDKLDVYCRRIRDNCSLGQYASRWYEHRDSVEKFEIFTWPGHRWNSQPGLALLKETRVGWIRLSYRVLPDH